MTLPNRVLGVMTLTHSLIEPRSLRNSLTDVAIASGFGVFELMLKRLDYPGSPIILGIVPGKLSENKLRTAKSQGLSATGFHRPAQGLGTDCDDPHRAGRGGPARMEIRQKGNAGCMIS